MAGEEPVVFDRSSAEKLGAMFKTWKGQVRNPRMPQEVIDLPPRMASAQWKPFVPATTDVIPAYAIMAIRASTYDDEANYTFPVASQPSTVFCSLYAINGSQDVGGATGQGGVCAFWGPCEVLFDSTYGSPAAGEKWGPVPGSWKLGKGWPATCQIIGQGQEGFYTASAMLSPIDSVIGKTTADVATGSTGTLQVWVGTSGSEAVSSPLLTVGFYNRTSTTLASSKYIEVVYRNGQAYGLPWEC